MIEPSPQEKDRQIREKDYSKMTDREIKRLKNITVFEYYKEKNKRRCQKHRQTPANDLSSKEVEEKEAA